MKVQGAVNAHNTCEARHQNPGKLGEVKPAPPPHTQGICQRDAGPEPGRRRLLGADQPEEQQGNLAALERRIRTQSGLEGRASEDKGLQRSEKLALIPPQRVRQLRACSRRKRVRIRKLMKSSFHQSCEGLTSKGTSEMGNKRGESLHIET